MKLLRLATIAALSTTVLAGGASAVLANEVRDVTTDGKIEFRPAGEEDGPLEVIPPETGPDAPDVEIDPEGAGTTGPLSIMKAATMNFGTQVISNQDQTYNMVAEMARLANPKEDGPTHVPYVSFAQVQDLRGTNAGWDLKVSLSDFEDPEAQNKILTGAQITFANAQLRYEGSNTDNAPTVHQAGLTLLPNGAARSVMTAAQGQGAGASSVIWGDQADLTAQFEAEGFNPETDVVENNAIQLSIPGSTAKDATTYTSTLTWELNSTPGDEL
ncbi:WxL domain-containing protein [Enterococcus gallinarum]|uniref:WxL domain-containing protein n=1 Tax=Enterococcus gallinarum TaxID=1353 RepID=UPI0015CFD907|nr:WxL domain-containing protein [Enterococcus gallinarum]MBF0724522.1 WxL domain-containing protein [Enterococcus gallinarum]NYS80623.1 WxL domain-containing protein [Enterococcus gallinarum]